ncbi:hypothetical protein Nmel_018307, partial [Mimus melanotis]
PGTGSSRSAKFGQREPSRHARVGGQRAAGAVGAAPGTGDPAPGAVQAGPESIQSSRVVQPAPGTAELSLGAVEAAPGTADQATGSHPGGIRVYPVTGSRPASTEHG